VATPTYSVYAATKFGVRGFTDALRREVGLYGVRVSGIYPGGVASEFRQQARIRRKTGVGTPRRLRLTCEQVAEAVWGLRRRPRRALVIPWYMIFAVWLAALFPGVADWLIEYFFVKRERE
jgi:short-subunit dehydrogenase